MENAQLYMMLVSDQAGGPIASPLYLRGARHAQTRRSLQRRALSVRLYRLRVFCTDACAAETRQAMWWVWLGLTQPITRLQLLSSTLL